MPTVAIGDGDIYYEAGAKLIVLPGGGHFVPQVAPEAYNEAVGTFLRAHQ